MHARVVLTRWPESTQKPIPVTERLPEEKDCDKEGRCWLGYGEKTVDAVIFGETLEEFGPTYPADWVFDVLRGEPGNLIGAPDVWLPYDALPLPKGEGAVNRHVSEGNRPLPLRNFQL